LFALGLLGACMTASSVDDTPGAILPRPKTVVVERFAVTPGEVTLDEGLTADVRQALEGGGGSQTQQEVDTGRKVADALADKLVVDIEDLGIDARRGTSVPAGDQPGLLITGQFVSIDQGNATERSIIDLGAGRSDVRVQAQVFEVTSSGRRLVDTIEVDAKSGLKPGLAKEAGVGAVTGRLLTAVAIGTGLDIADETLSANVVADADRAAKGIAKQLASFFGCKGWTS
jgi:hypothetical protein